MHETQVDHIDVATRLADAGVSEAVVRQTLAALPSSALGILLYGSQARGDADENSDIDLLVVSVFPQRTRSVGSVNVSTYDSDQFESASGTLFGAHIQRDAIVLHDSAFGYVLRTLASFSPADPTRILQSVTKLSLALRSDDRIHYVEGLTRLARYLLRTATYAIAIQDGQPCFSIRELAERSGDPSLLELLSSHEYVTGRPTIEDLEHLEQRLESIIGPLSANPYRSLQALIVANWQTDPELANSSLLALANRGSDMPYTEIPRVIL